MKISELIAVLEVIKKNDGDLTVCVSVPHEYWGTLESHLTVGYNVNIKNQAQADGPKSGKSEKSVVFGSL
jgi:hypothetical protein